MMLLHAVRSFSITIYNSNCVFSERHFSSFFSHVTATSEIYTLSLHDALPISLVGLFAAEEVAHQLLNFRDACGTADRKSTRLNSSHLGISYAVFCLKKKSRPHRELVDKPVPSVHLAKMTNLKDTSDKRRLH